MKTVSNDIDVNVSVILSAFSDDFAITVRKIESKDKSVRCAIVFLDGMIDQKKIIDGIASEIIKSCNIPENVSKTEYLSAHLLLSPTIAVTDDLDTAISMICEGNAIIITDGEKRITVADTKGYQTKSISEPPGESITKGPHEGFTEELLVNISCLRRKISSPELKTELMFIGKRTKTKIAVCYIEGIAKKRILNELKNRLGKIDCDEIFDSNYVSEHIRDNVFSPFKTVGSTERPDIVAAKLLEGRIAIIVNGTPSVLTVPYIFFEYFQNNEDYYVNFWYASIGRILRLISALISVSLPALYVSLTNFHQEEIPLKMFIAIASSRDGVPISNILEVIIMLIGFELLREASDTIPESFGISLSVVGSLVIGQVAVSAKLISAPVVFVVAITATTGLIVSRMKSAILMTRIMLLVSSSLLGIYGYLLGMTAITVYLFSITSFGCDYMAYLLPFEGRASFDVPFRLPLTKMKSRPYFAENKKRINDEEN